MRGRFPWLLLLVLCLGLSGFPFPASAADQGDIADVRNLYQDPFFALQGDPFAPVLSDGELAELRAPFDEKFFSPWEEGHICKAADVLKWVFEHFGAREGYGQNLRRLAPEWLERLEVQSDLESCGRVALPAISLVPASLRLLPTVEPFFLDPAEAGEGYPFDYLQNSGVHPGEPLFLSHYSRDGEWVFVEASYASGWMPVRDLAPAGETFRRQWRGHPRATMLDDGPALKDRGGRFLSRAAIGTILPLLGREGHFAVLGVPRRGADGGAVLEESLCPQDAVAAFPLAMTGWNACRVSGGMMGQSYGWGGFLDKRDCSATVRDFFLSFGIWLPRNSGAQARAGTFISFENMDRGEREEALLRDGVPFATLVAMRGHIMLYIGERAGRPLVLHNTWGLRTRVDGREGRHIIGETVITTLTPGRGLPDLDPERGFLIDRVTGMTLLSPEAAKRN